MGAGQANTTAIVNGCSTTGIAARICDELVLNGYSDWFLPSYDELNQMYIQRNLIGGFSTTNRYWCSFNDSATTACFAIFYGGGIGCSNFKTTNYCVRAIRMESF
jgi:hypothetical protein